jgi:hypothetical protein
MFYWIGFVLLGAAALSIALFGPHALSANKPPVVNNIINVSPSTPSVVTPANPGATTKP